MLQLTLKRKDIWYLPHRKTRTKYHFIRCYIKVEIKLITSNLLQIKQRVPASHASFT